MAFERVVLAWGICASLACGAGSEQAPPGGDRELQRA